MPYPTSNPVKYKLTYAFMLKIENVSHYTNDHVSMKKY